MDVRICVPPKPGHDVRDWINDMRSQGATRGEIFAEMEANCKPAGPFVAARREVREKETAEKKMAEDDIGQQIMDDLGIEVIGETEDSKIIIYCVHTRKYTTVSSVAHMRYETLCQITPEAETLVYVGEKPSSGGAHPFSTVRRKLGVFAGRSKRIDEKSLLEAGVWNHGNETVLVGEGFLSTISDRGEVEKTLHPRRGKQLYKLAGNPDWLDHQSLAENLRCVDPLKTTREAMEVFGRWRWKFDHGADLCVGLLLATWIQKFWDWRPQVLVTGDRRSGKSILFKAVKSVFGDLATKVSVSTSAVGIHDKIESTSKIVVLDELDKNKYREQIYEQLIRPSGRGDDERWVHGRTYKALRQIFWFAGIESGITEKTDSERIVRLQLLRQAKGVDRICEPTERECTELGQRILAVSLRIARDAVSLANDLSRVELDGYDGRVCETYAAPAACMSLATGEPASEVLIRLIKNSESFESETTTDRTDLLQAISWSHIFISRGVGQRAVCQLMRTIDAETGEERKSSDWEESVEALERCGIYFQGGNFVRLNSTNISRHLLAKTKFSSKSIGEYLAGVPDAVSVRVQKTKNKIRCWEIPSENLFEREDFSVEKDSGGNF